MKIIVLSLIALTFVYWLGLTQATGSLSIKFVSFDTKGAVLDKNDETCICDRKSLCDPRIKICFGFGNSSELNCAKLKGKHSKKKQTSYNFTTKVYYNTDIIEFQDTFGRFSNPLVYSTADDFKGNFGMQFVAYDIDRYFRNYRFRSKKRRYYATKIDEISVDAEIGKTSDVTKTMFMGKRQSKTTELTLEYKLSCDPHYYGEFCTKFCKPGEDANGEYTCNCDGEKQYILQVE